MVKKKVSKKQHPDHHPEMIIYIMLAIIVGGFGLIFTQQLTAELPNLDVVLEEIDEVILATPLQPLVSYDNVVVRHNKESPVVLSYYNKDNVVCENQGAWFHMNCNGLEWDKINQLERSVPTGASRAIGGYFVTTSKPGSYLCEIDVYCSTRSVAAVSTGVPTDAELRYLNGESQPSNTIRVHSEISFIQVLP